MSQSLNPSYTNSSTFAGIWLKGAYVMAALFLVFAFLLIGIPSLAGFASLVCLLMLGWIAFGKFANVVVLPSALLIPAVCFVWLELACLFDAEYPLQYAGGLFTGWVGALCLAILVANGVKLRYVIDAFFVIACANIVAILLGYDGLERHVIGDQVVGETTIFRRSGLAGQSNLLASLALLPLFLMVLRGKVISVERFVLILLMAVLITGYTASRNAVVMLIMFLGLSAVFLLGNNKLRVTLLIIAAVGAVLFLAASNSMSFRNLLEGSFLGNFGVVKRIINMGDGIDESALERAGVWTVFWQYYFENPFLGRGTGAFIKLTPGEIYAHNNFLELAMNNGIVAILLYYAMHVRIAIGSALADPIEKLRLISLMLVFVIADTWDVAYTGRVALTCLCLTLVVSARQFKPGTLD